MPFAPEVIVATVDALVVAVQAQEDADAVTATVAAPPAAVGDADVGEIEKPQPVAG